MIHLTWQDWMVVLGAIASLYLAVAFIVYCINGELEYRNPKNWDEYETRKKR